MTLPTPMYFKYFNKTYKLVDTPDGGLAGYMLNLKTGEFEENNRHIDEVLFSTTEAEISTLDEARFIDETEQERSFHLRGDGPVFALYETIDGLYDQAKTEGRRLTKEEKALIVSLRRRTFKMWEEELARRAAGESPSFQVKSILS